MNDNNRDLVKIECDPSCGFMVRSANKKEVTEIAQKHAKTVHQTEMSDEEAESKLTPTAA